MSGNTGRLAITREHLAKCLISYGEDAVAAQISSLSQETYDRIEKYALLQALSGMLLAKAASLAAVEVVEGAPRPLKRSRRIFRRS